MGSTGNGLADLDAYNARTHTYSAGDQVRSDDLNAIQDGAIAASEAVDTSRAAIAPSRTASENLTDAPAADQYGGGSMWVEKTTNGTVEVVLDTTLDWRDRVVIFTGNLWPTTPYSASLPGGGSDDSTTVDWADLQGGFFYAEQGQDGTASTPGYNKTLSSDEIRIYARDTDGALCAVKDGVVDTYETIIWGEFRHSPQQGHY